MSVYTKTGDEGTTSLFTGERLKKNSPRVEAYGTVDEMNAALGLARAFCKKETVRQEIYRLQKLNGLAMAELASIGAAPYITGEHVSALEQVIDGLEAKLPPLDHFLVPGDTAGGAALDMTRAAIRRAERRALELAETEPVSKEVLIFLNRMSDLCFVLMRTEESGAGE